MRYVIAILLFVIVSAASAQTVYSADLDESTSTLRAIMAKTERVQPANYEATLSIAREAQSLLERLIEISGQSSRVNIAMIKQGAKSDRELLLTTSIADALILALNLNDKYLDTRDKLFLNQALVAVSIAKSLRAGAAK